MPYRVPALFPGIRYAGRLAGDPPSNLGQGEATMFTGTGSQTGTNGRWGDYSMTTIDPSDGTSFWHVGEYYATNGSFNWHTRIGKFSFQGGGATPTPTPTATPASCSWAAGPSMPSAGTRLVGVFFPANGKFYAMGGRDVHITGASSLIRLSTIRSANSWTTKSATYPDAVRTTWLAAYLTTAERTTSTALAVPISPTRPLPIASSAMIRLPTPSALLLLTGLLAMEHSARWLHCLQQQALYSGWVRHHPNGGHGTNQIWEFTPSPAGLGAEECCPASSARLHTHDDHRQPHLHRWWRDITAARRSHRYDKLICL